MFLVILAGRFTFTAGSMTVMFKGGETVYVLSKGVKVRTTDYDIEGSHGVYYENAGVVRLQNADITSANLKMRAKKLYYRRKNRLLRLTGDAYFEDRYRKVSGDKIVAKGDSAWVIGDVLVESKTKGIVVEGDSAFYDGREAFGYVIGDAYAKILRRDTVEIRADMFLLHKDTTFGIGNVVATSRRFRATGDTFRVVMADTSLKGLLIFGNARVEWENGEGSSRTVEITFRDGYVEYVIFRDSARVVYREGGSTIDVSGNYIRAYSVRDTLKHIYVKELFEGRYR